MFQENARCAHYGLCLGFECELWCAQYEFNAQINRIQQEYQTQKDGLGEYYAQKKKHMKDSVLRALLNLKNEKILKYNKQSGKKVHKMIRKQVSKRLSRDALAKNFLKEMCVSEYVRMLPIFKKWFAKSHNKSHTNNWYVCGDNVVSCVPKYASMQDLMKKHSTHALHTCIRLNEIDKCSYDLSRYRFGLNESQIRRDMADMTGGSTKYSLYKTLGGSNGCPLGFLNKPKISFRSTASSFRMQFKHKKKNERANHNQTTKPNLHSFGHFMRKVINKYKTRQSNASHPNEIPHDK
ncbi:hypothetical protein RFI_21925 [Reticulomyxa filosa]|uniref:Uncharacterized protein n=1 Tax=Reticulomyxa filosa TaxID=46433 RepID=X6MN82_RETFI|nr:hypothetical protein RFI_21925 [Reticulomyxa filosa]|eukprot:ETO15438.1 hypothetical protein RFI_21925 [Reticulomyxa filosa]